MTEILGILNMTPDSSSDGGLYLDPAAALERAQELIAAGATIIDVGGESTRPGATRVSPEEEQQRILETVRVLSVNGVTVSVDTINASTAAQAIAAGAQIINDVSGGTNDPEMYKTVAAGGAKYILGHWRGIPDPEHKRSNYEDVTAEVTTKLFELAQLAKAAGIAPTNIILDPGFGFDKTAQQGWQLLRELKQLTALGYPVLVGLSRKRMIAEALAGLGEVPASTHVISNASEKTNALTATTHAVESRPASSSSPASASARDVASAAAALIAVQQGAWGVRVHNAAVTAQMLAVMSAAGTQQLPAPDLITLEGLEVYAHHGVFDFERERGQKFVIDAVLELDYLAGSAADDIAATVDYGAVADALCAAAVADPVDLIETLAERLAGRVLEFQGVAAVKLTVHKPEAPIEQPFSDVSITITRRKDCS